MMANAFFEGDSVARGEKEEGKGGVGAGTPRSGGRRKERRGVVWGRQSDCAVGVAPGGTVRGSSVRSRWRWADKQGRAAGRG
jgi:hypothetical protein